MALEKDLQIIDRAQKADADKAKQLALSIASGAEPQQFPAKSIFTFNAVMCIKTP